MHEITLATRSIVDELRALTKTLDSSRSQSNVTQKDLDRMENRLMGKITEVTTRTEEALKGITDGVENIAGDIETLVAIVKEIQNSPDAVTKEDAERLDRIEAQANSLLTRINVVKNISESNPNPDLPPTPTPPPSLAARHETAKKAH